MSIKKISSQNPYIIAEIGTAHLGSLEKAKKLIAAAAESGADCVKFQIVYADEILHPQTGFVALPTGNIRLYDRFKELEVDFSFYEECKRLCDEHSIDFAASPFGIRSYTQLVSLQPALVKIASPELNHIPLLEYIAQTEQQKTLPLFLSSGVSKLKDIEAALDILSPVENLALLHCVTSYPAPETDYNLKILPNLSRIFGISVGVSDHSLHPYLIPVLSVMQGGTIIEKHICLSKMDDGLDDPVAITPKDFSLMVKIIRSTTAMTTADILNMLKTEFTERYIDQILGSGRKILAPSERENYERTNRSIHFLRDMTVGETITEKDISVLRTEKLLTVGLHPKYYSKIMGKTIVRDAKDGEGVQWEHLISR
ncbi:MAG: N-acetylneuraminate synthase family protein [Treponemataceae bacterium]